MGFTNRHIQTRFGGLYLFGAFFIVVSLVLRTVLLVASASSAELGIGRIALIYLVGLFYDLVMFFYSAAPGAVYNLLIPERLFRSRFNRYLTFAVCFVLAFVVLFDAAAEWFFWEEFGARFNFIAIDYLVYTQELVGNIRESYPAEIIIAIIAVVSGALVFLARKPLLASLRSTSSFRQRLPAAAVFLVIPALSILFVDSSLANISSNRYNNELAKNGAYSFCAAFRNNVIDYEDFYLTRDDQAVFKRLKELLQSPRARFVGSDPFDITRQITSAGQERKPNVVLIMVESLNCSYMAAFGNNDGLTPNLDAIANDSLLFRNLYATGTRTVRGLEAVILSIPPTPGSSVVKRPGNENMFSIGFLFQDRGYDNKFVYGGHGYFDNMNYFFENNGFRAVDRGDLSKDEITFSNAWGVCDEDLLNRALKEGDLSFAAGKPFFTFVVTTSNHRPYTYPQKIDIPSGSGRSGAVKYTDYAIGDFIRKARQKPWFDNTVFLVTADHCAGSAGRTDIPVDKYHIPLIVYAPGLRELVKPARIDSLASQVDVGPTLLGLLNWSYQSRFFGKDILESNPRRALMGNYQKIGLLMGRSIAVLDPQKRYRVVPVDMRSNEPETIAEQDLLFDTITYYQAASYLLKHNMNRK
jgi:phosphoglycerol transferase MdoB-like AlkP superfamily enzyme